MRAKKGLKFQNDQVDGFGSFILTVFLIFSFIYLGMTVYYEINGNRPKIANQYQYSWVLK